jgi:uncharacterized protein YkwD
VLALDHFNMRTEFLGQHEDMKCHTRFKYLRVAGLLVICLLAVTLSTSHFLAEEKILFSISPSLTQDHRYDQKAEEVILQEINRIRVERGLRELKLNGGLQEVARKQSRAMSFQNVLSHGGEVGPVLADRLKKAAFSDYYGGENIARTNCKESSQSAVDGWVQSPGHLQNILGNKYSETGIGVVVQPDGWIYLTQIFIGKDAE